MSASIVIYDDQPDRYNKYCNSYELREFNMNAFMIYMFVWMEIHVRMHSWRKWNLVLVETIACFVVSNKLTAFDDIADGFKYNFNELLLQQHKIYQMNINMAWNHRTGHWLSAFCVDSHVSMYLLWFRRKHSINVELIINPFSFEICPVLNFKKVDCSVF